MYICDGILYYRQRLSRVCDIDLSSYIIACYLIFLIYSLFFHYCFFLYKFQETVGCVIVTKTGSPRVDLPTLHKYLGAAYYDILSRIIVMSITFND